MSGADATKGQFNVGPSVPTVTGAVGAVETTDLSAIGAAGKVTINVGGTNFYISNTTLKTLAGAQNDANVTAAISGADTYGDGTGTLLSSVANVSIDATTKKITITAKNPQQAPILWNTSGTTVEDQTSINNAFGMNTYAQVTGANAATIGTNLKNTAAVWDTGAITAASANGAATFRFNGVTVNMNVTSNGGSNVGTSSYTDKTQNLTIDDSVDSTAGNQATQIVAALNQYKATANGGNNELSNFTFAVDTTGTGIDITDTQADGALNNALAAVATDPGSTNFAITNVGSGAQLGGTDGVTGVTKTAADTSVTINLDGTNYTLDSTALQTLDGTQSLASTKTLIGNAVDSSGNKLSSVASITSNAGGDIIITSKTAGSTSNGAASNVKVTINGTNAASVTNAKTALGISSGQSNTGAIAVSQSNSTADQAASLQQAIAANAVLGARFGSPTVAYGSSTITLNETAGSAAGVTLGNAVVAGAGTNDKLLITNTGGQNLKTVTILQGLATAGAQAKTGTVDTSFQVQAQTKGTELNGVTVAFSGLTNTANANALTSTWDADSKTLTVSGNINNAVGNTAATISTAMRNTISSGLQAAGYSTGGALNATNSTTNGNALNILDVWNGNSITFGSGTGSVAGATTVNNDTLTVDQNNGNLTIYLANTSAYKNTAANIQAAVNALGNNGATGGIDFSKYQFAAQGNWDTSTLGNDIAKGTSTMVGGTVAVDGSYSFGIDKAFAAGDVVNIKGQNFTAVDSGANASKGEFNVAGGDLVAQAAGLNDAISLNSVLKANYSATVSGSTITMTEKAATGVDMQTSDVGVTGTGTQGQYSVAASQLLTDGASFSIDGQNISVSSKTNNVGYANGTAIQQASTLAQQTSELSDAINTNSTLNQKYTASVDTDGNLLLTQKVGSSDAPSVQMTTSTKGDFTAKLQIGANSGQTMTVNISDMRSLALGISGDGSTSTVEAKDGSVASYVATADVSNGTDNTNVEYGLDISTADKATAAISVIDDATNAVSAERSNLGAFQNRLEHTINNLGTASQNITTAEANIRDVDMASEMTNFQKNNILQQAAQAMLAQANQQPQGVLQLLR